MTDTFTRFLKWINSQLDYICYYIQIRNGEKKNLKIKIFLFKKNDSVIACMTGNQFSNEFNVW